MALDARIPLMAQGMNLEPRSNALMRASQLEGSQQANALRQMQMQQMRDAAQQSLMEREAAAQKEAKMAEVLRGLQPVNGAQANRVSGVTGPRPEAAAVIGQRPQVDPMQLLQAGFDPKMVEFIMNSPNLGRPEVARTVEVAGANGSPETRQFDKFGQPVGASLPKPVQRQMANAGGSLVPYNPYTQADPIGVTLTPGQIQSNATTIRGQNMQDGRARDRLNFDVTQAGIKNNAPPPAKAPGPMSVTLQKELLESDDTLNASKNVVRIIDQALKINDTAYSGAYAKERAIVRSNLGGESESANATIDLDNMMTGQALESLKSIFGGVPTEGERKILLDMQASAEKTPTQRKAILDRARIAAERRGMLADAKAKAIRDGTYLTDGIPDVPEPSPQAPTARSPQASGGLSAAEREELARLRSQLGRGKQ